ncbi:unnamed protein product, partial [marine sediment metagenome]
MNKRKRSKQGPKVSTPPIKTPQITPKPKTQRAPAPLLDKRAFTGHDKGKVHQYLDVQGCPTEFRSTGLMTLLRFQRENPTFYKFVDEKKPDYGASPADLEIPPEVVKYLSNKNILKLYTFQEQAFTHIEKGSDIVIEAPTGQGKTEAFILPLIKKLAQTGKSNSRCVKVLLLYPTKALAHDQYGKI